MSTSATWIPVKNLNGTSNSVPKGGYLTWKAYWEKEMQKPFGTCSCKQCSNLAEVGAHVKKVGTDNKWYIVPLCKSCNGKSSEDEFEVRAEDLCPENLQSIFG
jgi:hypothetical protein